MAGPSTRNAWCGAAIASALAVACGDGAPVELRIRPAPGLAGCPRAGETRTLLVSALGERGELRQALDATIAGEVRLTVPDDTRQVTIEALGPGGEVVALGASRPLAAPREAATGAVLDVDVAMLPPDGVCEVGALPEPAVRPQLATLGPAVLVAAADGAVRRYDVDGGDLTEVALPAALMSPQGLRGATLTALGPGRAVLIGGPLPAFAVYLDGDGFGVPGLFEPRAHHGALALDATHVLVVGGCSALAPAADGCAPGTLLKSTRILDVTTGEATIGPNLRFARLEPVVLIGGVDQLGQPTSYLIMGGRNEDGTARSDFERIDLVDGGRRVGDGGGALVATLATGAQLVVPSSPLGSGSAVFDDGFPVDTIAARTGGGAPAAALALADGRVAVLGGDQGASLSLYEPMSDRWVRRDLGGEPPAGAWQDASATMLEDGTVLIAGGLVDGVASDRLWRYRPSLTGPWQAAATVTPLSDSGAQLVPLLPGQVERGVGWRMPFDPGDDGRPVTAVFPAPQVQGGVMTVVATVDVRLDLIAGAVREADGLIVRLIAGAPAELRRRRGDVETSICVGATVAPWAPTPQTMALTVDDDEVVATVDGAEQLRCAHDGLATFGRWGVATGSAGAVTIATATLQRGP